MVLSGHDLTIVVAPSTVDRDPVYYSRVLFPTLASYLNHNRKYFIPLAGQRSANSASREEKLIILRSRLRYCTKSVYCVFTVMGSEIHIKNCFEMNVLCRAIY